MSSLPPAAAAPPAPGAPLLRRQPWARFARNLESLPDFCIIHILRHLPLIDLLHVAQLNQRLASLTCSFRAAHTLDVARLCPQNDSASTSARQPLPPIQPFFERLLDALGVHVDALVLDMHRLPRCRQGPGGGFYEQPFFDAMQRHVGRRLRHLTVKGTALSGDAWDAWPELFAELRTLRLHGCGNGCDYAPVYSADMHWRRGAGRPVALLGCRNLERLSLVWCRRTLHVEQLVELVGNNPRLRQLQLHHYTQSGSAQLVPAICQRLAEHLEVLSLHYVTTQETSLTALATLPLLRKLQLVNYHLPTGAAGTGSRPLDDLLEALRGNRTLHELDLHHCRPSLHSLAGMRTLHALRHLRMRKNYWWTDEGAAELAGHGRLLSIDCYDSLNLSDAGVVALVAGNERLEQLEVSWVPQLTGGLLARLHEVVRGQHAKAAREAADEGSGGKPETARQTRQFRVMLNGRNKIDWEVAKREAQQVDDVGAGFSFRVMTLRDHAQSPQGAGSDAYVFQRCYNAFPEDPDPMGGDEVAPGVDEMRPLIEFN